ncbi:MAG: 50S ribosomal protein L10 [Holosporales bacterium]|jgi:large subunit ribosomal protein L10|nr:50S ribosomal protein L10 [Holosporales bacterium]
MKRQEKEAFVSHMREELLSSSIVVAVDRTAGITVDEITRLRRDMRSADANFKVLKNTLARIAIKDSTLDPINEYLEGPTGLAYSNNPIGLAKELYKFAKENEKLKILGGVMDGKAISFNVIKELASLPSLDELHAKIIGLLTAAASKIIGTVSEPARRLAVIFASRN